MKAMKTLVKQERRVKKSELEETKRDAKNDIQNLKLEPLDD